MIPQLPFTKVSLKITYLKLNWNLPGSIEFNANVSVKDVDWIENQGEKALNLFLFICFCFSKVLFGRSHQNLHLSEQQLFTHDDVIKWKHFLRYWTFVREIHRSSVNSPHKGQWRGALIYSLIRTCINGWVNNGKAGDLRHHRTYYDVTVMDGSVVIP